MAISGDIEKLERRWMENPTGLMFAPLAEAYRKAGEPGRALEILEQGLSKHPEYVPALIVRGRCQIDQEGFPEAEGAFQLALDRDPVNPIALRGLAEVFERTGRNGLAIERLEVLLEVDRGDSQARADLARLRALPVTASVSPSTPASGAPETARNATGAGTAPVADEPPLSLDQQPKASTSTPHWAEWMPGAMSVGSEEPEASPVEPAEVESLVGFVTNDSDGPLTDLLEVDEPVAESEPEESAPDPAPAPEPVVSKWSSWQSWRESASDADAEVDADIEGVEPGAAAEPEVAVEAVEAVESGTETEAEFFDVAIEAEPAEPVAIGGNEEGLEPDPEAASEVETEAVTEAQATAEDEADADAHVDAELEAPSGAGHEFPEPRDEQAEAGDELLKAGDEHEVSAEVTGEAGPDIEAQSEDDEPVAIEDDEPVAIDELVMTQELIVTESMAEVFLRQGHRELALAVYRQLVVNPGYDHLQETIADLERATAGSRDPAQMVPAPVPDPSPAPVVRTTRRGAAADTGGVSVATFLREVLDAPPPTADSAVLPPAIERGPAGEPTRDAGQPLSLSDVFGEESPSAAHPAIPAEERRIVPEPEPPAAAEPSYDEFFGAASPEEDMPGATVGSESEHLEQFNEWLRGLKR